jgi:hypothetical protein
MRQGMVRPVHLLISVASLMLATGLYAWILLSTAERGSNLGMLVGIALLVGAVLVLAAGLSAIDRSSAPKKRFANPVSMLVPGVTLLLLYPVHQWGRSLYLEDQTAAQRFIERRLAAADELHRTTGKWPADQRAFLGDEPLPRMMRYNFFYYRPTLPEGFELYIQIDFDGGWHLTHERRDWRRST